MTSECDEAMKMTIEAAVERAEQAFWGQIVAAFPSATSGDLDPAVSASFERAARVAVEAWVRNNVAEIPVDHVAMRSDVSASGSHAVAGDLGAAGGEWKADGERRLFVRASADESGEMEEPEWAQIKIDQAFLDELAGYRRSMDAVNAFEIRAQGTPWAWRPDRNGEERYGESFDGEYIVCSPHGFHFVAHGERGGSIYTREVSFAELERMLAEPNELMVHTDEPNGSRSAVLAELEEHFDNFDDGPSP